MFILNPSSSANLNSTVPSKGISVIIPCLNEKQTLARCITDAQAAIAQTGLPGEVVIADNGSTDGSQQIALAAGARVEPVAVKGYGAALHAGILAAQYEYVVFADADLSYPFAEVPKLIEPLKVGSADFVLGSRLRGAIAANAMPKLNRYVGTPILSWLIRRLFKLPTSDCNSGMRAVLRSKYPQLKLHCPGMEYASEMLISVALQNWRYQEVPIAFFKDQRGRAPHLRRWRDGWRHLRFIIANSSSVLLVFLPSLLGILGLLIAFGISLQGWYAPQAPVHYHTAFICLGLSIPFLLFSMSAVITKSVLVEYGAGGGKLSKLTHWLSESAVPFYVALCFFVLTSVEAMFLFYEWWRLDFGLIANITPLIRIMIYSIAGAILFCLDMALGLLRLIPKVHVDQ
jgi:glycosyltransferase involved in cell wall biosynthesis